MVVAMAQNIPDLLTVSLAVHDTCQLFKCIVDHHKAAADVSILHYSAKLSHCAFIIWIRSDLVENLQ